MLGLHNLKAAKKSTRRRKIIGRGSGSGHGNYSTRGMKGQRARSGGKSGLALRSMRTYVLRIPKSRGFQSIYPKFAVVNLTDLDKNFKNGDKVNGQALLKLGLIKTRINGIKILASGELKKKLIVEAEAFSKIAQEKIEAAGGQIKILSAKQIKGDKVKQAK
ncbi:MAG: 50S ribosomal protein L15 [Patescibacteria group bacterium]